MRDHVFKSLHIPQPPLEGLARLDKVKHARLIESLCCYDIVIRCRIEEGKSSKVGQYCGKRSVMRFGSRSWLLACVAVDATHFLGPERVIPHDLVLGRRPRVTHVDSILVLYIDM